MKTILFDLDGTIMDSGEGIMESAQYALNHFGFEKESLENLRRFVGPSLMYSFTTLANAPFMNLADVSSPYFFASSTASFIATL